MNEQLNYLLKPTGFLPTRGQWESVQKLVPAALAEKDAEIQKLRAAMQFAMKWMIESERPVAYNALKMAIKETDHA